MSFFTLKGMSVHKMGYLQLSIETQEMEVLTLTIIEQVEHKNLNFLAEREVYWQHQLRAYIENGYRNHCRKKEI